MENTQCNRGKPEGQLPLLALGFLLLQCVHQFRRGEDPHPPLMPLDSLDSDGGGQVSLAGSRPTDQYRILRTAHELAAVEATDQGFIHPSLSEVEARQVTVRREAGRLHLVGQ